MNASVPFPRELAEIIATHRALFGGFVMETNPDGEPPAGEAAFKVIESQDELNRIVGDRLARERAKFADYDDVKAKADQFDALQDQQKSIEDKAKEREAEAIKRAEAAEAKALRREVALEHNLSPGDAALLDGVADEEAMKALAKRLATDAGKQQEGGGANGEKKFVVPGQGTGSAGGTALTGRERAQAYLEKHKL